MPLKPRQSWQPQISVPVFTGKLLDSVVSCEYVVRMPNIPVNGRRMQRARLRKGWTLRDLSGRCSELGRPIDFGNIAAYERGDHTPNPGTLLILARALDVDVDDLLAADAA